jgi:hypothetical protein
MHEEEPLQSLGLSQSAKPTEPTVRVADDLQFQKAEFTATADADSRCALCRSAIGDVYYHLGGSKICKVCAGQKQATLEPVRGRVFGKSVLYGLGAAVAGSALYGIVLLATGAEFALLSILVGIMVGKAMMHGSGGRGGRKLQIVAVLLTYGSITTGYVPSILKGLREKPLKTEASNKAASPARVRTEAFVKTPIGKVVAVAVFLAVVVGLSLIFPFLMITQGFSGILGVAILFFGLQRAWIKTKADGRILMGPYPATDLTPSAASA